MVVTSPLSAGSQWAHAINTIKHADAFAQLGHDVVIIRFEGNISNSDELLNYQNFTALITILSGFLFHHKSSI